MNKTLEELIDDVDDFVDNTKIIDQRNAFCAEFENKEDLADAKRLIGEINDYYEYDYIVKIRSNNTKLTLKFELKAQEFIERYNNEEIDDPSDLLECLGLIKIAFVACNVKTWVQNGIAVIVRK